MVHNDDYNDDDYNDDDDDDEWWWYHSDGCGELIKHTSLLKFNTDTIAQWLERWTGNPEVAGSNPAHCYTSAVVKEVIG